MDLESLIKFFREQGYSKEEALAAANSILIDNQKLAGMGDFGKPDLTVMHEAQVGTPTVEPMVPQDVAAWQAYKQAHPVMGYAKERMVEAGRGAKAMLGLDGKKSGVDEAIAHAERLSAAKMLQDYLMHQDIMRGAEHQKDVMNRAASTPGILDYLRGMVPTQPSPQQNADTLLSNMGAMGPAKR